SDGIGSFTLSTSSALAHSASAAVSVAPTVAYSSSRIPLPAPAPASTSTVWPRSTSARTPAGVSATRCSPGLISLGAPTITRLSYRTTRARRRRIDVCALRERRGVASLSSMSIVAATPVAERVPDTGLTLRQYYVMVGLGAFVTTIAQPGVIGRLPLRLVLKDELHFNAQALAAFMLITTFAWNVKPIAGILSDAFPLFGTRRRHYMLVGAGL